MLSATDWLVAAHAVGPVAVGRGWAEVRVGAWGATLVGVDAFELDRRGETLSGAVVAGAADTDESGADAGGEVSGGEAGPWSIARPEPLLHAVVAASSDMAKIEERFSCISPPQAGSVLI